MGIEQSSNPHIPDYADWLEATYAAPFGKLMADKARDLQKAFRADVERTILFGPGE